ncbi:MAG: hypothetical protein WEA09_14960 [Gemmatimonadota bacterium]
MRHFTSSRWILLGMSFLVLQACEGRWVEYTATVTFSQAYSVRADGPTTTVHHLTVNDLAGIIDDIPDDADILSMEISHLGGTYNVLPATTASSVEIGYVIIDDLGRIEPVMGIRSLDGTVLGIDVGLRNKLQAIPQTMVDGAFAKLKARLNDILTQRRATNPRIGIGFQVDPLGGPFHADLVATATAKVQYRVCEDVGNALVVTDLDACTTLSLD